MCHKYIPELKSVVYKLSLGINTPISIVLHIKYEVLVSSLALRSNLVEGESGDKVY